VVSITFFLHLEPIFLRALFYCPIYDLKESEDATLREGFGRRYWAKDRFVALGSFFQYACMRCKKPWPVTGRPVIPRVVRLRCCAVIQMCRNFRFFFFNLCISRVCCCFRWNILDPKISDFLNGFNLWFIRMFINLNKP